MFSLSGRRPADANTYEPLESEETHHDDNVLFSASLSDEEDGEHDNSLLAGHGTADSEGAEGVGNGVNNKSSRSVRFQESVSVRVYGPPLRSTMASREAGTSRIHYVRLLT